MKEKTTKKRNIVSRFLVGNLECSGWMFIYAFLEVAVAGLLFAFYFAFSNTFKADFLQIFEWVPESVDLDSFTFSMMMAESLMKLTNTVVLPIIGLSGIVICGLLAIKCKKKKITVVRKLGQNEVLRYILIGSTLNLVISTIINLIPEKFMSSYAASVNLAISGNIFLVALVAGIIGPISEEILFRHFIFEAYKEVGIKFAIIGSAISFGIMHGNLIQGAYACIFGLVFASIDYKKDNLIPSIIMHITINLSSVLISFIFSNEIIGLLLFEVLVIAFNYLFNRTELMSLASKLKVKALA